MPYTRDIYYTAQVCGAGHVVIPRIEGIPGIQQKFCSICGAETSTTCTACKEFIRGTPRVNGMPEFTRPAYCPNCGAAFPWTASAVEAANKLARRVFDEADRNEFADVVENLVKDSPSTHVAIVQFKDLMEKVKPTAVEAFKKLLETVVTEGTKKILFPGS